MTDEPPTNANVGAGGEAYLTHLASLAGFAVNQSAPDLMGWDLRLETPPRDRPGVPLDQRRPEPAFYIQVKTIRERDTARVPLSLSAAERLAMRQDPAFVCVLVVDDTPAIVRGYLVHLRSANLARLLKRLRVVEQERQADPDAPELNKRTMIIDAEKAGAEFALDPKSLGAMLREACPDADRYHADKLAELKALGYQPGRFSLDFAVRVTSIADLVDFTLGILPLELEDAKTFEERFDIKLPVLHLPPAEPDGRTLIKLKPAPICLCRILAHDKDDGPPAAFDGAVYASATKNVPLEEQRLVFRTDTFEIDARGDGRTVLNIGGSRLAELSRHRLHFWSQKCSRPVIGK